MDILIVVAKRAAKISKRQVKNQIKSNQPDSWLTSFNEPLSFPSYFSIIHFIHSIQ